MSNVPRLLNGWPYVVMVLSVVLPGTGTLLSACIGYSTSWSKTQLFIGMLQLMTAVFLVGWIWSIWWGWKILHKSLRADYQEQQLMERTGPRSDQNLNN